jgi:pimeloyl-ACP methyl ester carboxylesterase
MSKKPKPRRQQARFDPNRGSKPPEMVDLVEGAWVLKALAGVIGLAVLCAYACVCGLFWYGQWQLVLRPSRTVSTTPASVNLAFTEVHFGVDASGQPQLDGWWIPGDNASEQTVLMLHGGDGSMADALPQARTLHDARLNVLLFDYRGYGRSGGQHPAQIAMQEDAHTALDYLLQTRSVHASELVVYGKGLGASLALQLCATTRIECPALVLDAPDGDLLGRASADPRAKMVPTSLLFHERFPLAEPLRLDKSAKLLISYDTGSAPQILKDAHDPKMLAELKSGDSDAYLSTLRRFLDEYRPRD